MTATIRAATDADGFGLAALLGAVFSEYQGCVFVSEEMPEIAAVATTFHQAGGAFWVAERAIAHRRVIVGSIGYVPATAGRRDEPPGEEPNNAAEPSGEEPGIELRKLYVAKSERNTGLGGRLLGQVEAVAVQRRARFIALWSDTRFATAHAFYEKRGFFRGERTRELHDASASVEYYFRKTLG